MRGQYFSFDAVIASIIFMLAFVTLISYWESVKYSLRDKDDLLNKDALSISDAILKVSLHINNSLVYEKDIYKLSDLRNTYGKAYKLYLKFYKDGNLIYSYGYMGEYPVKIRRVFSIVDKHGVAHMGYMDLYLSY